MRDLEAHLQSCAECRAQLSEWEDTAAALAFASLEERPLEPSRELRGRILEAIRVDATSPECQAAARFGWGRVVQPKKLRMDIGRSLRMWCH